jgi:hypothetical protein
MENHMKKLAFIAAVCAIPFAIRANWFETPLGNRIGITDAYLLFYLFVLTIIVAVVPLSARTQKHLVKFVVCTVMMWVFLASIVVPVLWGVFYTPGFLPPH